MRKVLIIIPSFQLGGTNTSLNFFLNQIINCLQEEIDLDIYALDPRGPNAEVLSKFANLINLPQNDTTIQSHNSLLSIKKFLSPLRLFFSKIFKYDLALIVLKRIAKKLENRYDTVVAYQEGQCTKLISLFKDDSFKVAWVHCEFSSLLNFSKGNLNCKPYGKVDRIVCVSKAATDDFIVCLPQYKEKVVTIYNQIDSVLISNKAKEFMPYLLDKSDLKIVSVGRIDLIKRFSHIPKILASIKSSKTISWYIIGGIAHESEYKELTNNIEEYNMSSKIKLLGPLKNPYPYIKNADLLVCLSSSESFSYVITESKILGTPVVTTDYPCSKEFLISGKEGEICKFESMSHTLSSIIEDGKLQYYRTQLQNFKYSPTVNKKTLNKIGF